MTQTKRDRIVKISSIFLAAYLMISVLAYGQQEKLKAIFIYKVALNVTWPDEGQKFVIGIYGKSSTYPVLNAIARARKVRNSVVFVRQVITPDQVKECNIVVYSNNDPKELEVIKKVTKESKVLLIAENQVDAKRNWHINMKPTEGKLSYEINKSDIADGLVVSEKLISAADKVH